MNPQAVNSNETEAMKCGMRSCNRSVKVESGHFLCNSHRRCNHKGIYDPERCDMCRSMFTQANSSTRLATGSKANLSLLIASMRKSTAFHRPLVWVNPDFKKLFTIPLNLLEPLRGPRPPASSSRLILHPITSLCLTNFPKLMVLTLSRVPVERPFPG